MNRRIATLVFGVLFCAASTLQAEPQTHDGFYLQLGAGVGGYHTSADALGTEITYSGVSIPLSLMLGGTLFEHLVIGGGFFVDVAPSPTEKMNGTETSNQDFNQYVIGFGAFADYYVWSDKGLHFPLFMGWGGLETSVEGNPGGSDPTGFIMYVGAGYDFFISDNWSFGGLFRFVIAPSKLNDVTYTTIEPGILATMTFN